MGNAGYAWLQQMMSKLSPSGVADMALADGSLFTLSSGEGDIGEALVEAIGWSASWPCRASAT